MQLARCREHRPSFFGHGRGYYGNQVANGGRGRGRGRDNARGRGRSHNQQQQLDGHHSHHHLRGQQQLVDEGAQNGSTPEGLAESSTLGAACDADAPQPIDHQGAPLHQQSSAFVTNFDKRGRNGRMSDPHPYHRRFASPQKGGRYHNRPQQQPRQVNNGKAEGGAAAEGGDMRQPARHQRCGRGGRHEHRHPHPHADRHPPTEGSKNDLYFELPSQLLPQQVLQAPSETSNFQEAPSAEQAPFESSRQHPPRQHQHKQCHQHHRRTQQSHVHPDQAPQCEQAPPITQGNGAPSVPLQQRQQLPRRPLQFGTVDSTAHVQQAPARPAKLRFGSFGFHESTSAKQQLIMQRPCPTPDAFAAVSGAVTHTTSRTPIHSSPENGDFRIAAGSNAFLQQSTPHGAPGNRRGGRGYRGGYGRSRGRLNHQGHHAQQRDSSQGHSEHSALPATAILG